MKYQYFIYKCENCESVFKAIEIPPSINYGLFIMRSLKTGEEVLLKALEDPVYKEVDEILKKESGIRKLGDRKRADVLQRIFKIACDNDSEGNLFHIAANPKCPNCDSTKMEYWEETDPPEIVEKEIPTVTHNHWNSLTHKEKINLIKSELKKMDISKY